MVSLVALALLAFAVNAVLKSRWGQARQRLMHTEFVELGKTLLMALGLAACHDLAGRFGANRWLATPLSFVCLVAWGIVGLRVARVSVFEWLFANSAREGVPVLLVDLATLGGSLLAGVTLLHKVFLIEVTSLIATSAVASVVLALALQDTLGHLFAGISLQLDRPFRLGDWVEVRTGSERISGQVLEVSWRATTLVAMGDELIVVPNKSVATGLVLNYSGRERPFVRTFLFRVPLNAPVELAKQSILEAARQTPGVLEEPAPLALLMESTESWLSLKAICFVGDYGRQHVVGDAFQTRVLKLFAERGVALATAQLQLRPET